MGNFAQRHGSSISRLSLGGLALILALAVGGCATSPPAAQPALNTEFVQAPAEDDSTLDFADSLALDQPALVDESLQDKILRSHPDFEPLEELYRHGSEAYSQDQLDLAEEHFLLLKQGLEGIEAADDDSLAVLYLSSLRRKLDYYSEILAEERFFKESYAPIDQSLEDVYDSLQTRYGLPGFLLPQEESQPDSGSLDALLAVDNPKVEKWMQYYQGRGRPQFSRWLARYQRVGPTMASILEEENLPSELVCAAMIESGLQPKIRSRAGAVGWWQFMRSTARHRGLQVDEWIDERRDIEMSTRAAAKHFALLHRMFQDWALALAAYNSGEYRIQRAIGLSGEADYWTMRLPRETREYVPKFIAAARIVRNPEKYGFEGIEGEPLAFDRLSLDDAYSLSQVSKATGISTSDLRALNPQLLAGVTPPGRKDYGLRVPAGEADGAMEALAKIPEDERITWRKHRLRRGETLGLIARRYHTSVHSIMQINGISNARRIRAGRVLTIPYPRGVQIAETSSRGSSRSSIAPPPPDQAAWSYKVRRGDTLVQIARESGCTVASIRRINSIRHDRIFPGQELVLHVPEGKKVEGARLLASANTGSSSYTVRKGDTL
ncbi:MAG TPA: LysM peptidoglycan-binding domain-containing protein, partial [Candidatus Krumholzibacteria bacterium]|nr:LysM peptidoglycan-binding domain-containing protein [Candidatus Krumholzibacteria bacterium]